MKRRAVRYDRYGKSDVLYVADEELPAPGVGEILVRIHAASVNPKDVIIRAGRLRLFRLLAGRRFPKHVGYDWSGEALAIGPGVRRFSPGDALYGMIDAWTAGACATHAIVRATELARKPTSLSWEEAAAVPLAAMTALQALRDDGRLRAGDRVLVNGASGGVGTFAVQIAKALGSHVVGVTSARNADFVRELGADVVVDYASEDIRAAVGPVDVFFDVFGNRSFGFAAPILSPHGRYVTTVPKPAAVWPIVHTSLRAKRARLVNVRSRAADLETIASFVAAGKVRPRIDRVFSLDAIAAAHDFVATKHARGKVVVSIDADA